MLSETKLTRPSRQWLILVLAVGLALAMAFSMLLTEDAQAKKKKKNQSSLRNFNRTSTVAQLPTGLFLTQSSNPLTGATPYTFNPIKKPKTVNNLTVTVNLAALNSNDTGLFLGLDGIDTGIPLRGFTNFVNFTATGTPNNGNQIAKAAADGQLVGTIIDRTPGDNNLLVNNINTTLNIKGKSKS